MKSTPVRLLGASLLIFGLPVAAQDVCTPHMGPGNTAAPVPVPAPPPRPVFTPGIIPVNPTPVGGTNGGATNGPVTYGPTTPRPDASRGDRGDDPSGGGTTPSGGGTGGTTPSGAAVGGGFTPGGKGAATPAAPRGGGTTGGGSGGAGAPARPAGVRGGGTGGATGGATGPGGGQAPSGRKSTRSFETAVTWEYWWGRNSSDILDVRAVTPAQSTGTTAAEDAAKRVQLAERTRMSIVPFLKAGLADRDASVRAASAVALGKCGDENAEALLIAALDDKSNAVRESACLGLGLLATPGARAALLDIAVDSPNAAKLLGRDHANSADLRGHACAALGLAAGRADVDMREIAALAKLAAEHHKDADVGVGAIFGLGLAKSGSATPTLIQLAVEGETDAIRSAAAAALGKIGDRSAIPTLVKLMDDKSVHVRRSAVLALGGAATTGDASVVQALAKKAVECADAAERRFAIADLGVIGGAASKAILEKILAEADAADQAFAAMALGFAAQHDDAAERARIGARLLKGMQESSSCETTGAYAIGCALLKFDGAKPEIRRVLMSQAHDHLRVECAQALGMMRDREAVEPLFEIAKSTEFPSLRFAALQALGLMRDPTIVLRINGMMSETGGNVVTGGATLRGLGLVGDGRLVLAFGQVLRNATPSPDAVRAYAATALGLLGDKDDVSALLRMGRGENYVSQSGIISDLLAKLAL